MSPCARSISRSATRVLPAEVCVLQVAPLLRELVVSAVAAGPVCEPDNPQSLTVDVILDQIRVQPVASLALPMPSDPSFSQNCAVSELLIRPINAIWMNGREELGRANECSLDCSLLKLACLSGCGDSSGQRRLLRALELLASGNNVTVVALALGYENKSAFIAMFRRYLGETPADIWATQTSEGVTCNRWRAAV